jgi:flagellar biosynthetic protein FliS
MMLDVYQRVALDAAPRRRYPSLVWRGILKLIRLAEEAIQAHRPSDRHQALIRAQQLVGFMDGSFRDELFPEVAPALHDLHRQVVRLLVAANLNSDLSALGQAREVAMVLDNMWTKAADTASPDLESRWHEC